MISSRGHTFTALIEIAFHKEFRMEEMFGKRRDYKFIKRRLLFGLCRRILASKSWTATRSSALATLRESRRSSAATSAVLSIRTLCFSHSVVFLESARDDRVRRVRNFGRAKGNRKQSPKSDCDSHFHSSLKFFFPLVSIFSAVNNAQNDCLSSHCPTARTPIVSDAQGALAKSLKAASSASLGPHAAVLQNLYRFGTYFIDINVPIFLRSNALHVAGPLRLFSCYSTSSVIVCHLRAPHQIILSRHLKASPVKKVHRESLSARQPGEGL